MTCKRMATWIASDAGVGPVLLILWLPEISITATSNLFSLSVTSHDAP